MTTDRMLPTLLLAAAIALLPGCQGGPARAPAAGVVPPAGPTAATATATAVIHGRAVVDVVPLANAEVTVYDPLRKQAPVTPGVGDGVRVEWAPAVVRTDAAGNFVLPLALKPGQAAEIFVTDGKRSVCAVLVGPDAAVRNAGKTPFSATRPLVVDVDTSATTGLMLNSLAALGRAAAAQQAKGPEAVLAMQAKALDAMAAGVGPAAAKLRALASTVGIATTIARHMVQADPRLPAAALRALLAAEGGNPVLSAVVSGLETSGVATEDELVGIVGEGADGIEDAVGSAFGGDDPAMGFVQDLTTELRTAAADDEAATRTAEDGQPAGPTGGEPGEEPGTAPGTTPGTTTGTTPGFGGDWAEEGEEPEAGPGQIDVEVTAPTDDGAWDPPADPISTSAYRLEERP